MIPRLKDAKYVGNYKLKLTFEDGKEGEINLESELWGEVFEPLKDQALFQQFKIDPELHTVVWPTGADLAPEYLYQECA